MILRRLRYVASLSLLVLSLCVPVTVLAQKTTQNYDPLAAACRQGGAQAASQCKDTSHKNPLFGDGGVITRATQLLVVAVGAISVIMIIIGGFKYVVSSGDSSNVESAKNTILYAVIGLVIALIAQSIILVVLRRI